MCTMCDSCHLIMIEVVRRKCNGLVATSLYCYAASGDLGIYNMHGANLLQLILQFH